jgi:hypothetical protein
LEDLRYQTSDFRWKVIKAFKKGDGTKEVIIHKRGAGVLGKD